MDIGLSDEQQLLHDTAKRLAEKIATTDTSDIASGETLDGQWREVVELGLPTFRSPDLCGLKESGVETALVVEQLARTLTAVPAVGQGVLVPELLHAANAETELELVAEGTMRLAPVLSRDLSGFGASPGVTFDAAGANNALLVVPCADGWRLVMAPIAATSEAGLDLTRQMRHVPDDLAAAGSPVGEEIDARRWRKIQALALTAVAADLVGVMQGALDDAVRYAGERAQFGVKIGSFQAIQHMLADALVRVEGARSCLWHAAWAVDELPPDAALLAAMTAKAYASDAGRDVVEAAVQVFGGIAITWEHVAHLRVRRMLLDRRLFGDETAQYGDIAAMRLADEELA